MERRIRKILTFVKLEIASKRFGKIIPQPLQFKKDSSSPRMTEQIQTLQSGQNAFLEILKYSGQPKKCFQCVQEETVIGSPCPVQPSFVNCTCKFSNVFAKEFSTMQCSYHTCIETKIKFPLYFSAVAFSSFSLFFSSLSSVKSYLHMKFYC